MADIFQDDFLSAELGDMENFLFASGDENATAEDEDKNDVKEDPVQNEDSAPETQVESVISQPKIPTLEELANSDFIRNRQLAAKSIVEYLHEAGSNKEALHSVISIMCKLSEDEDLMVRSELMEHIPSIALFCKEHSEELGVVIRQQIVPYTVKLLTDIQIQVRKIGRTTLIVLLENNIIDNSQLSEWICPLIAQLATSESTPEELRCEDVSVMCKMIPYVGKEITEKFFLEPFLSLCCDSSSSMAEVCLQNFGNLSKILGRETTESILLPVFLELCQDLLHDGHLVDICVDLASVVSPTTRNEVLSPVYINFLKSKYLHYAATLLLGRFISTFADPTRTGLCYRDGIWMDIPVEEEHLEDVVLESLFFQQDSDLYFECLTSQIVSNPQFLDECSFRNLNNCLTNNYGFEDELPTEKMCTKNKQTLFQFNSQTALREYDIEENSNIHPELTDLHNNLNCEKKYMTVATNDSHLYLHVDNQNLFNNFQFWRTPLPEIELDSDVVESKSASINLKSKIPNKTDNALTYASELSLKISPRQTNTDTTNLLLGEIDDKVIQIEERSRDLRRKRVICRKINRLPSSGWNKKERKLKQEVAKEKIQMAVYDQNIVPPELLQEYVKELPNEEVLRLNIAYYLPSVAYTLGRKYWPCLRNTFYFLSKDLEFNIQRSVASSLHELAVILGQDITTEDLLPVFLDLFKHERLRAMLLKHISQFLRKLGPYSRKQFLPLIQEICAWEDESNWRYRLIVAEQLIPCIELFTSCEALHFFPVSLILLQDKVSAVRRSAVELLAVVIKSMVTNSKSAEFLKAALCALDEKYRKGNKWLWRQMYVYICQELAVKSALPTDYYVDHVVPNLFSLAWDTVPNVRLAVARCLGLTLLPLDFLPSIQKAHYQLLLQVMYSLQSDVDKDVRHFAHLSAAAFNVLPPKKMSPA